MNTITVCYSTHRPETLGLTARIMQQHDVLILEEPPHPEFPAMLNGEIDIEEHMLELDLGYPLFALQQYRLLQVMSMSGMVVLQIEPYLEELIQIQEFFADGHAPDELDRGTTGYDVYCCEKEVTGLLIDYYRVVRGNDYAAILSVMQQFARADAARFRLRDVLRSRQIITALEDGMNVYIEAGSIHLMLHRYLAALLPPGWSMQVHFVERDAMRCLGVSGSMFSPGDELTLSYLFEKSISRSRQDLLCAQSLIHAKLVHKDEEVTTGGGFPHTRNELETTRLVRQLSLNDSRELFFQIRSRPAAEAWECVRRYSASAVR